MDVPHIENVGDCVHQLRNVGHICSVLVLVVVRVCEIVYCGCSMESVAPLWVPLVFRHQVVPVTRAVGGRVVTSRTGGFAVSSGF